MQYKVVAPPSNLPMFSDEERNGRLISGVLAENFKKGNLSAILKDYEHTRAVDSRKETIETLKPVSELSSSELKDKEVIEKDGQQFAKCTEEKKVRGYKIYKNGILL
jgi:hypothetical protein